MDYLEEFEGGLAHALLVTTRLVETVFFIWSAGRSADDGQFGYPNPTGPEAVVLMKTYR